jgi:hypothetical protein
MAENHQAEIKEKDADIKTLKDKIQEIQPQLDEKKSLKIAKDGLGNCRNQLAQYIYELGEMGWYDYNKKYPDVHYKKYDPETNNLIQFISSFLRIHFSNDMCAFFMSKEGMTHTPNNGIYDSEKWQCILDNLHHHARQLDKIIEKQL